MNKGIIVTIYDSKAETYSRLAMAETNADAIRQFDILVNDSRGSLVSTHPQDFTMFRVGSFENYVVKGEERQALANGIDVKRPGVSEEK